MNGQNPFSRSHKKWSTLEYSPIHLVVMVKGDRAQTDGGTVVILVAAACGGIKLKSLSVRSRNLKLRWRIGFYAKLTRAHTPVGPLINEGLVWGQE